MTDSSTSGIVDWHTHVWLPEHLGEEWGTELDSKSTERNWPVDPRNLSASYASHG